MINKTVEAVRRQLNNELLTVITSNEDKVIRIRCHFERSHLVLSILAESVQILKVIHGIILNFN